MEVYRASYKCKFVLTGSGSATSPRFCIGDGRIGVRANIHLGGQTEFCPNGFGGGGVEIFRDPYSVGGG